MDKIYWWTKVKIEDSTYSTDKEKLVNLIKEGNHIYFEYYKHGMTILITPQTKIEVRDLEVFINNCYRSSDFIPKFQKTRYTCFFDLDSTDFRYKLITKQELNNLIRKNP